MYELFNTNRWRSPVNFLLIFWMSKESVGNEVFQIGNDFTSRICTLYAHIRVMNLYNS